MTVFASIAVLVIVPDPEASVTVPARADNAPEAGSPPLSGFPSPPNMSGYTCSSLATIVQLVVVVALNLAAVAIALLQV